MVARWCGWAAVMGGLMWAIKAIAILVTGYQPPLLFALPVALFPVGLLGLHRRLGPRGGRRAAVGGRLAAAAVLAGSAYLIVAAGGGESPAESVAVATASLATLVALILLGAAARAARLFPAPWRSLPLGLGLATPVLIMFVGGALEAVHERLLEVPLLTIAVGWVALGAAVAREPEVAARLTGHMDS